MTHPLICPCLSSVIAITRTFRQESDEDIERKSRSCFVGNLSFECDEDQLSNWCSSAGQVVSSVVMRRGKRSTGSGLVEFTDVAAAQNAVATLNGTEMDGRVILVREDRVAAVQQTEVRDTPTMRPVEAAQSSRPPTPTPTHIHSLSLSVTSFFSLSLSF